MGRLYDYCCQVQRHIDTHGLDVFKTRGALAIECGFLISLIDEGHPDDPEMIAQLQRAARSVLDLDLD